MESKELYRHLLGLAEPWTVERVELDMAKMHVEVFAAHAPGARFGCPECGKELAVYDHLAERVWRHLDSCQFLTFLHARPPRVSCSEHGVRQVHLPCAEAGSRFTHLFQVLAIDVLRAANVKRAAEILRISWDEAWHLMERAVLRGRAAKGARLPTHLGIDEKSIAKGHRYMTLVCDLKEATIEYVGEDRGEHSLAAYFEAFALEQRQAIEAICLDMWKPYMKACHENVPQAAQKMVFDRFHIMRQALDAVDKVRKREHRALLKEGDTSLAKTRYLWLYSAENVPEQAKAQFQHIRRMQLKTARAWALKESLRQLWDYTSVAWARRFWKHWYFWATHSRLAPMVYVAKLIARYLPNVLTYFTHRVTNAVAEGLNSKIATVQKRACGYRNRDHFKIAAYFHCGGLNLYPARGTHTKAG